MAYVIDERVAKKVILGDIKMELNYTTMRGASVLLEGERLKIVVELDRDVFVELLKKTFIDLKGGERE